MRVLLGIGVGLLIGRWVYLNMKEKAKEVEKVVKVEVEKIVEVATDNWRS